jgi:MoxR-like ATPase
MPSQDDLMNIVFRTAETSEPLVKKVADGAMLLRMRRLAHEVPMARHVVEYATRLVLALQPGSPDAPDLVNRYVRLGASPRGAQALCLAGRIVALLEGRFNLAFADVKAVALPALRHRIVLSFDAQRQGVTADSVIEEVVAKVPEERR